MSSSAINEQQVHTFLENLFGEGLHAKRVLSLAQAYYRAIPNMPEHRLRPLLERFAQLVYQQPIVRENFGLS